MTKLFKPKTDMYIVGVGSAVGAIKLSNQAFIQRCTAAVDAKILEEKTGVRQRYFLATDQALSDIAVAAAKQALLEANIFIEQIDKIIVATSTADYLSPSMAAVIQHKLGANEIPCFDIGSACAGFIYAMDQAMRNLETGDETILVIGADARSRTLDFDEAYVAGLYGDGAGAFVISKKSKLNAFKIKASLLFADVTGVDAIVVPSVSIAGESQPSLLKMNDASHVMKAALKHTPAMIKTITTLLDMPITAIDKFVFHQPNFRLLQAIVKKLGIDIHKAPCSFKECGNTVAASIPLTFHYALEQQSIRLDESILLVAMGAGFSGGCILIQGEPDDSINHCC